MFTKDGQQLGERIRKLREEAGWSLRTFSRVVGLSKDSICAIEKGHTSPNLDSLFKIAHGLNITLSDLFKDIGPMPRDAQHDQGDEPPLTSYQGIEL